MSCGRSVTAHVLRGLNAKCNRHGVKYSFRAAVTFYSNNFLNLDAENRSRRRSLLCFSLKRDERLIEQPAFSLHRLVTGNQSDRAVGAGH